MTTSDEMSSSEMEYDESCSAWLQCVSIMYISTITWTNLNSSLVVSVVLTHVCPAALAVLLTPVLGFFWNSESKVTPAQLFLLYLRLCSMTPNCTLKWDVCGLPLPETVGNCLVFQLSGSYLSRSPSYLFRLVEGREGIWREVLCPKHGL